MKAGARRNRRASPSPAAPPDFFLSKTGWPPAAPAPLFRIYNHEATLAVKRISAIYISDVVDKRDHSYMMTTSSVYVCGFTEVLCGRDALRRPPHMRMMQGNGSFPPFRAPFPRGNGLRRAFRSGGWRGNATFPLFHATFTGLRGAFPRFPVAFPAFRVARSAGNAIRKGGNASFPTGNGPRKAWRMIENAGNALRRAFRIGG